MLLINIHHYIMGLAGRAGAGGRGTRAAAAARGGVGGEDPRARRAAGWGRDGFLSPDHRGGGSQVGGAEEHRLEDLRGETQKFGEGEGSGRIPPAATRVFYSGHGTGDARAGTRVNPNELDPSGNDAATRRSPLGMWLARSSDPLAWDPWVADWCRP